MQYILTEEEYKDLKKQHDDEIKKLKKINIELAKKLSLHINNGVKCMLNSSPYRSEMYCCQCDIKDLCLEENKEFHK